MPRRLAAVLSASRKVVTEANGDCLTFAKCNQFDRSLRWSVTGVRPAFLSISLPPHDPAVVRFFNCGHRLYMAEQTSYRWYILAASFLLLVIDGRVRFSFGVLIKPLVSES
jgi:hypothetical protein